MNLKSILTVLAIFSSIAGPTGAAGLDPCEDRFSLEPLGNGVALKMPGSELLRLSLHDRDLHRFRQDFIARYQNSDARLGNTREKVAFANDFVRSRMKYALKFWTALTRPYGVLDYASLVRSQEANLGEFLKCGVGVCRHQAVLLKVLLDDINVPARFVVGTLQSSYYGVTDTPAGHAWVVVPANMNVTIIADPAAGFVREATNHLGHTVSDTASSWMVPASTLGRRYSLHYVPNAAYLERLKSP